MSGSIDERIVEMSFQGSSFLSGIEKAILSLAGLKDSLNGFKGADDDLNALDDSAKKFSLSGIANSLDSIKSKFSATGIIGLTVMNSLVSKALEVGSEIARDFVIDPIKDGFESYETQLNATKTILSNTAAAGTTMNQVVGALATLNTYANKTVYNFGQMAAAIGTFTAAGVGLNQSVKAIQGIANIAAFSGASAEQAQRVMQEFSEALSQNKLLLRQWQSAVNAGIGGKTFQNALIATAQAQGIAVNAIIKQAGSFRASLNKGWVTSSVLTQALSIFTGTLSAQQLKAMGYTQQESVLLAAQGKTALQAATQVRTISALFADLKEEVATAFAAIFKAIIGNISNATSVLSAIHQAAENALTTPIYDLAKILQGFTDLGGRTYVIAILENAFHALADVIDTVRVAFTDVFGSGGNSDAAGDGLINLTLEVLKFSDALIPSKKTLSDLKDIFVAVFTVIQTGLSALAGLFSGLGKVGDAAASAGPGILGLVASFANWVTNVFTALQQSGALTKFFSDLGTVISLPLKGLALIVDAFEKFTEGASKAVTAVDPFISKIGSAFSKVASAISAGLQTGNFQNVINILNSVLLGGILVAVKKFIQTLTDKAEGESGATSFLDTIKESFEGLTGALKTMQTQLKAKALEDIAIAVGLLTISLLALSFINVANLTKALTAITVMMSQLIGAMSLVADLSGSKGVLKMAVVAAALNLLATALVILSGAVAILGHLSWDELLRGLTAVTVLMTELVISTKLMGDNAKGTIAGSYAMESMAEALDIMASAVKKLGELSWSVLEKGVITIAALLLIVAGFQKIGGGSENLIASSLAMLVVAAALVVMGKALVSMGSMSWSEIGRSLIELGGALLLISSALYAMQDGLPGAAALAIAAVGLAILTKALASMGNMSWSEIGKSLVELTGALIILAAGLTAMIVALPGAAALVVVAAGLAILTPVLVALGSLSWEQIGKGLGTLAGVFVVLGAAAVGLGIVAPILVALGLAVALVGAGILASGTGVILFAAGLTALGTAIAISGTAIINFVKSILATIPYAATQLGLGVVDFAKAIGTGSVAIENAFVQILQALLRGITTIAPEAAKAFETFIGSFLPAIQRESGPIITTFLNVLLKLLTTIGSDAGKFATAGGTLLVNFLNGIRNEVPKVATAGANIVIALVQAISSNSVRIIAAAANAILQFINGLSSAIRAEGPRFHQAGLNLASAIVEGIAAGIGGQSAVNLVKAAAEDLAGAIPGWVKKVLNINSPAKVMIPVGEAVPEGIGVGMLNGVHFVEDASKTVANTAVKSLQDGLTAIGKIASTSIELNPKITPVVDLSQAKAGFSQLSALSKSQLIGATASTASAATVSAAIAAAQAQATGQLGGGTTISFEQNNYSPQALSAIDIYRKTKNQISVAKGVLAGNANASGNN